MSEYMPSGCTVNYSEDRIPFLVTRNRTQSPIELTDRVLSVLNQRFGNNLLPLIQKGIDDPNRNSVLKVLDCPSGKQVLAASMLASAYPETKVYAVDLLTRKGLRPNNLLPIVGDIFNLPIDTESIDIAYCYGFFYYLEKDERFKDATSAMHEIARVLAPGGCALINADYRTISRKCNKNGKFEAESHTSLKPMRAGYTISDRLLVLYQNLQWVDNRFVFMQKSPK